MMEAILSEQRMHLSSRDRTFHSVLINVLLVMGCLSTMASCTSTDDDIHASWERTIGDYRVHLTFVEGGQFWMEVGVMEQRVEGNFRVEGEVLTITDKDCGTNEGVYRIHFSAEELILTSIEDPCGSRELVLSGNWLELK